MTRLRHLLVGFAAIVASGMPAARAMELVATIALPGVKGRIDHLSADPRSHRIFVAALGNGTVEVLDTQNDQRRTISGLGEPQGVLYLPDSDRLFIANGGSNRVDLLDVASLSVVRRVGGMDDADNVRYDANARKSGWDTEKAPFGCSIPQAAIRAARFRFRDILSHFSLSKAVVVHL